MPTWCLACRWTGRCSPAPSTISAPGTWTAWPPPPSACSSPRTGSPGRPEAVPRWPACEPRPAGPGPPALTLPGRGSLHRPRAGRPHPPRAPGWTALAVARDNEKVQVSAVVFDFDGLLMDTEGSLLASWQFEWRQHGLELDPGTFWVDHGG